MTCPAEVLPARSRRRARAVSSLWPAPDPRRVPCEAPAASRQAPRRLPRAAARASPPLTTTHGGGTRCKGYTHSQRVRSAAVHVIPIHVTARRAAWQLSSRPCTRQRKVPCPQRDTWLRARSKNLSWIVLLLAAWTAACGNGSAREGRRGEQRQGGPIRGRAWVHQSDMARFGRSASRYAL